MMDQAAEALLNWYDSHKRVLPWRDIRNPYATWISEIMLQQTRVETVLRYYPRFLERFPTVQSLADAPTEDVLKLWEGLGYYSRARNLQRGAQQVMERYAGVIPCCVEELSRIKGIGTYTAGAIASIAYGQRVPAVDGNVIRVASRLFGIRENAAAPSGKRMIADAVLRIIPEDRPGDFNQAVMDLGARICTPGTPDCDRCPLAAYCDAYAQGDADELPLLPQKKPPKELRWDVILLFCGERVLMRRRTEKLLEGLWVFPMLPEWNDTEDLPLLTKQLTGCESQMLHYAGEARHVFTHQVWNMQLWIMQT